MTNKLSGENAATRKQLESHKELFDEAVEYLLNQDHKIAFIGNIGTGKTTAICYLLGLLDGDDPVLSTGSGRTTLCEVMISTGKDTAIKVTPHTKDEVRSYLKDFAQYLYEPEADNTEDSESFKLSAEVERALRNMLDLRKSRKKNSEGQRITIDHAKIFAAEFDSVELLIEAMLERADLSKRNQTLFTKENGTDHDKWLHEKFKAINSGTHPNVGLAKHIHITTPIKLFDGIDYDLSVIDTKGVDNTVNRSDLDQCLTDNRTISVLCCRFNDAPDNTMSGLLRLAKNAGLSQRIAKETILLILDRDNEAENVIEIDEPIGDKVEGREIREDHVVNDLKHTLQLDDIPVKFIDVKSDDPQPLNIFLAETVSNLRNQYAQNMDDIEKAVKDIETEMVSQSAQEAKRQVKNTLEPWLKKAQSCSPMLKAYFQPLIDDIQNKGTYASSVRASVNRRGEWHNLNYYQLLANGAREQVVKQIGVLKDELLVLIDNMLTQNDLQPAYALLKQIKQITERRLTHIYQQAFEKGSTIYKNPLQSDTKLWTDLSMEWGRGPGYKGRIASKSDDWFQKRSYSKFEGLVTKQVDTAWERYITEVRELLGAE